MSDDEMFGVPDADDGAYYEQESGGFDPNSVIVQDDDAYGEPPEDEYTGGQMPQKRGKGFSLSLGNKIALISLALLVVVCVAYAVINHLHNNAVANKDSKPPTTQSQTTEPPAPSASETQTSNRVEKSERWREIADLGSYVYEQTLEQVFTVKGVRRYALTGSAEPQVRLVAYGSLAAFDGEYEVEIPLNTLDKMVKGFQFTVKVDVYSFDKKYIVENPRAR